MFFSCSYLDLILGNLQFVQLLFMKFLTFSRQQCMCDGNISSHFIFSIFLRPSGCRQAFAVPAAASNLHIHIHLCTSVLLPSLPTFLLTSPISTSTSFHPFPFIILQLSFILFNPPAQATFYEELIIPFLFSVSIIIHRLFSSLSLP